MINKENIYKKIQNLLLNGKLFFNFNLASYKWLKTGGNADIFFIPEDVNIGIKISRVKQMLQPNNSIQASNEKYDLADLYEQKLPSVVMIINVVN